MQVLGGSIASLHLFCFVSPSSGTFEAAKDSLFRYETRQQKYEMLDNVLNA